MFIEQADIDIAILENVPKFPFEIAKRYLEERGFKCDFIENDPRKYSFPIGRPRGYLRACRTSTVEVHISLQTWDALVGQECTWNACHFKDFCVDPTGSDEASIQATMSTQSARQYLSNYKQKFRDAPKSIVDLQQNGMAIPRAGTDTVPTLTTGCTKMAVLDSSMEEVKHVMTGLELSLLHGMPSVQATANKLRIPKMVLPCNKTLCKFVGNSMHAACVAMPIVASVILTGPKVHISDGASAEA